MSKIRQSNKERRKQPSLTPKEKKAAKQMKLAKNQTASVSRLALWQSGGATGKVGQF